MMTRSELKRIKKNFRNVFADCKIKLVGDSRRSGREALYTNYYEVSLPDGRCFNVTGSTVNEQLIGVHGLFIRVFDLLRKEGLLNVSVDGRDFEKACMEQRVWGLAL